MRAWLFITSKTIWNILKFFNIYFWVKRYQSPQVVNRVPHSFQDFHICTCAHEVLPYRQIASVLPQTLLVAARNAIKSGFGFVLYSCQKELVCSYPESSHGVCTTWWLSSLLQAVRLKHRSAATLFWICVLDQLNQNLWAGPWETGSLTMSKVHNDFYFFTFFSSLIKTSLPYFSVLV